MRPSTLFFSLNLVPALLFAQAPVAWETSLGAAQARAKAERKPILMVVGQSTCPACVAFKQDMAKAPGLAQALLGAVPLDFQLDGKDGKADPERMKVAEAYQVKGVPAVFLLNAEGNVIRIIGGDPKVEDLSPFIEGRPRPVASKPADSTPGLSFPKPTHDFGSVKGDQVLTHRFKVINTGKTPLTIQEAKAGCGCTSTVVGKSLLAPGESGEIEAIFNTKGQQGKVAKTIQVTSDDAENPVQTLTLEAEVTHTPEELKAMEPLLAAQGMPSIDLSKELAQATEPVPVSPVVPTTGLSFPEPKHDFGPLTGELEVKHRFKVTNTGNSPLQIKEAKADCGCTSTVVGKSLLAPGESGEIEAIFNTKGQRGKVAKSIRVATDDAANPVQTLTLEAEITPEVLVEPAEVQFMNVRGKTVRVEQARLKSGRNQPLRITSAKVVGADYLSATPKQEFMDAVVEVRFDPTRVPGGQLGGMAMVEATILNEKAPKITFPVRWTLMQAISTQPVGFYWNEPAGEAYQGRVTLRQISANKFQILSVKSSNPEFQIKVSLHKPATAQEATILVPKTIKPGQYTETITFTTDDPDQPVVLVPVRLLLRVEQG